ncbi:MAG: hypothetical protein FWG66_01435, partial [Spirochaetes bacterium]|nr:hypothetical protein [Spirochaetota bacterium]
GGYKPCLHKDLQLAAQSVSLIAIWTYFSPFQNLPTATLAAYGLQGTFYPRFYKYNPLLEILSSGFSKKNKKNRKKIAPAPNATKQPVKGLKTPPAKACRQGLSR